MEDVVFIRRCVELALKAGKNTRSNPMVGALMVHDNTIISEGWHQRYGGPHAEVMAIESVPLDKKHLIPESTLYVSLEPCCVHGKTPPCTDLIIRSGIKKVVIGSTDPDERMRGKGMQILSQAGIEVMSGVFSKKRAITS
ncbi:MAG: hypothetical protein IPN29_07510 [Saprospiraceae bacterium]|nr:hypothetical protein [Saprospiraceae bacterium]